ncbi:Mitochodrial transcription termination factor [Senna tora]|uniref:Mitochodrial transcription termination factor n=1 Tax=Senna tora TaxID=362788 RepID=A0A834TMG5_9FABA|nr:Mitochodrial transcription termination factor [Senna tora]
MLRLLSIASYRFLPFLESPAAKTSQVFTPATCSTICLAEAKEAEEDTADQTSEAAQIFRKWGCDDVDLVKIFNRNPQLRKADTALIQSNLSLLNRLGLGAPDLVRIINCRPRFLSSRVNVCFDERLAYLSSLFESKEMLKRVIVTNPSLLTYDFNNTIKQTLSQYQELGVNKQDFFFMLCSRPTLICRTSFNEEKLDYIRRTGISKDSKMYKYVVTIMGISRIETMREKIANFARFGFSEDEVLEFFGRSPLVLTLSVDKVQRNMTFILGTMKLEAKTVVHSPHLLFFNLDTRLKPRFLVLTKIQDMDCEFNITESLVTRAVRMKENRFVNAFIKCRMNEEAGELMELYTKAKEVKRLAGSSRKCVQKGFPF